MDKFVVNATHKALAGMYCLFLLGYFMVGSVALSRSGSGMRIWNKSCRASGILYFRRALYSAIVFRFSRINKKNNPASARTVRNAEKTPDD
jgi:hypothetical protein